MIWWLALTQPEPHTNLNHHTWDTMLNLLPQCSHHHRHRHLSSLNSCAALRHRSCTCMPFKYKSFMLMQQQPPGTIPSASSTDHVATANQILTDARTLRETLAAELTEAGKKLSEALLDVLLYTENVESTSRLLALADSCISQIRSRMRAQGIPIPPPPPSLNTATPSNSVNGPVISGEFISPNTHIILFLMR